MYIYIDALNYGELTNSPTHPLSSLHYPPTPLHLSHLALPTHTPPSLPSLPLPLSSNPPHPQTTVCFFVLCRRHWINRVP